MLAMFEDDWATGQILRQYINGKRKYENAKVNGKAKVGGKRRWTSPTNSVANEHVDWLPSMGDEIESASFDNGNDGGGDEYDDNDGGDDDGWVGFTYSSQVDASDGEYR